MGDLGSKCKRQEKEKSGGGKTKFLVREPLDKKKDFFSFPKNFLVR